MKLLILFTTALIALSFSLEKERTESVEPVVQRATQTVGESRMDHPISTLVYVDETVPEPVRSVNIYSVTTTTTTTLPVEPYKPNSPDWICPEYHDLAIEMGWPEDELSKLSYVMYRESRCRPDQHNPDDPMGGSNGLVQINQFWCKPTRYWPNGWLQSHGVLVSCDDLYIAGVNLKAALAIWENSGWSPWNV
jgi:hypothetical protein